MKKTIFTLIILLFASVFVFSQVQRSEPGRPVEENIGADTAQQKLKEISVSKFEDAGFWKAMISMDQGIATARRLEGGPSAKKPIPDEEAIGITEDDKYVLGVKTEFFRRGDASISIHPVRPIGIAGIVKTLSVWVVGRNYNHTLKVIFQDFGGQSFELTVGKLNFAGWKQLVVAIPPTVQQRDFHFSTLTGIKFLGFRIECELSETYGSFYIYLDDMRVVTDLFAEETRDIDDMLDSW